MVPLSKVLEIAEAIYVRQISGAEDIILDRIRQKFMYIQPSLLVGLFEHRVVTDIVGNEYATDKEPLGVILVNGHDVVAPAAWMKHNSVYWEYDQENGKVVIHGLTGTIETVKDMVFRDAPWVHGKLVPALVFYLLYVASVRDNDSRQEVFERMYRLLWVWGS